MPKAAKIAISLPDKLLRAAERKRKATRETRSQFFCRAVETLLAKDRELEQERRYIEGYRKFPETEAEIAEAHRLGMEALAREPWE